MDNIKLTTVCDERWGAVWERSGRDHWGLQSRKAPWRRSYLSWSLNNQRMQMGKHMEKGYFCGQRNSIYEGPKLDIKQWIQGTNINLWLEHSVCVWGNIFGCGQRSQQEPDHRGPYRSWYNNYILFYEHWEAILGFDMGHWQDPIYAFKVNDLVLSLSFYFSPLWNVVENQVNFEGPCKA